MYIVHHFVFEQTTAHRPTTGTGTGTGTGGTWTGTGDPVGRSGIVVYRRRLADYTVKGTGYSRCAQRTFLL